MQSTPIVNFVSNAGFSSDGEMLPGPVSVGMSCDVFDAYASARVTREALFAVGSTERDPVSGA